MKQGWSSEEAEEGDGEKKLRKVDLEGRGMAGSEKQGALGN